MTFTKTATAVAVTFFLGTLMAKPADPGPQNDKKEERQNSPAKSEKGASQQRQEQQRTQPAQRAQQPERQPAAQPQQQQRVQPAQQPQRQEQPQRQQQAQQPQRQEQPQRQQQAQQPQRQEQPQRQQQAQQPQRQQQVQQQRQEQPQRSKQQAQAWQQQRGWLQNGAWKGNDSWQRNRAQNWSNDHRTWEQRGGYGGYYIPQASFSLYFGSQHFFRLRSRPTIYLGYPRFEYNGYSFLMLDPWPEYWQEDWYANDDVYVDYDDGYYLYNRRYPSVRLAISLSL